MRSVGLDVQITTYGRYVIFSLAVVAVMVLQVLNPVVLNAQSDQVSEKAKGITISPPLKELVLSPGLIEAEIPVSLTNTTGKSVLASLRLVDFKSLDEFGGVSLGEVGAAPASYGLAQWMKIAGGSQVELPANQTTTVTIKVLNRDDMSPGGHYGALVASLQDKTPSNQTPDKISLKQELVSLIFAKKLGGEKYDMRLEPIDTKNLTVFSDSLKMRFTNTGNVHIVPRGYIEITDPKGKLVAKGILNPESIMVLPDSTRQFVTLLQQVGSTEAPGTYKLTVYYRYDGKNTFEEYKVNLSHGKHKVWLIVGAGVGFLLGAALFARLLFTRRVRRHSRS